MKPASWEGKGSEHACSTTTPRGCSAHRWVGEQQPWQKNLGKVLSLKTASAATCLSHNSCRSCLPAVLCRRRLAAGGMVRSHWSPYESILKLAFCTNTCRRWAIALKGASNGCAGWYRMPAWRRSTVKPGMMRSSTSSSACRTQVDKSPAFPNLGNLREKHWHCNDLTSKSAWPKR